MPLKTRCVLPTVQIDGWSQAGTARLDFEPRAFATTIMAQPQLLACSLLHGKRASTIVELVDCVRIAEQTICPFVSNKQFYLASGWRVRFEHMDSATQAMIAKYSSKQHEQLCAECQARYNAAQVISCIYSLIGTARTAGVRAFLLSRPPETACSAQSAGR